MNHDGSEFCRTLFINDTNYNHVIINVCCMHVATIITSIFKITYTLDNKVVY